MSFVAYALCALPAYSNDYSNQSGWNGFYRGMHAGAAIGKVKSKTTTNQATYDLKEGDKSTGGVLFGWNGQSGRLVYGLEGGASIHEIKGSYSGGGLPSHSSDYVWNAEFRARLGLDMGRFMPFVAGGPLLGEFYQASKTLRNGDLEWVAGFTAGAGVDMKVFRNIVLRAEYLYEYLGEHDFYIADSNTTLSTSSNMHMLRLGILTRFGNPLDDQSSRLEDLPRFAGSSFGVHGGYGIGKVNLSNYTTGSMDTSSANIGVTAGYLFDLGKWRLGAETELTFHQGSDKGSFNGPVTSMEHRLMWHSALRAKVGYVVGDSFMPYVTAGLNLGQFSSVVQTNNITNVDPYKNGYSVGAGLEYALNDKIVMDLSYLWNSYKDNHINIPGNVNLGMDTDFHQIRVGFKFR